jgi:hypothetical protein
VPDELLQLVLVLLPVLLRLHLPPLLVSPAPPPAALLGCWLARELPAMRRWVPLQQLGEALVQLARAPLPHQTPSPQFGSQPMKGVAEQAVLPLGPPVSCHLRQPALWKLLPARSFGLLAALLHRTSVLQR